MTIKTNALETFSGDKRLDVDKIVDGSAKAWAHFNGASASVVDSYNVSSLVDRGVGLYTLNFISSFTSPAYASTSQCNRVSNGNWWLRTITSRQTASSIDPEMETVEASSSAKADPSAYMVVTHGDLA